MIVDRIMRLNGAGYERPSQWLSDWMRGGGPTASGVAVNEESALTYSAVWAATCLISETVASLPLPLYRRMANGGRDDAREHPLYRVLHDEPSASQDSFVWWEMMTAAVLNWGNGYAEILRARTGEVIALDFIHPRYVRPYFEGKELYYHIRNDDGQGVAFSPENMLHITGKLSPNGVTGTGVISQARESIGMGKAVEQYGASFFGNGARPAIIVKYPARMTEDEYKRLREQMEEWRGSRNAWKNMVLQGQGTAVETVGIPPEDAQFLETRQHNITEIARWYRVPPHLLADLSRATFSNIEQENLNLVIHSIRPWLVRFERAIRRQLLKAEEKAEYYPEFTVDALLRGDSEARTRSLTQQFLNGALTLNEWRRMENRNPVPGPVGDMHFVPLNLTPAERVADPPVPAQPAEQPPVDAPDGGQTPASNSAAIGTILRRIKTKQRSAITRAGKHPGQFVQRVEAFFASAEEQFACEYREALRIAGWGNEADAAAHSVMAAYCHAAMAALLTAAEVSEHRLEQSVSDAIAVLESLPVLNGVLPPCR